MGSPKAVPQNQPKGALSCCLTLFLSRCPQCLSASKAVPKKRKDALGLSRSGYRRSFLPGCPRWLGCGTPAQCKPFPAEKMAWLQLSLASFDLADCDGHELELLQGRPLKPSKNEPVSEKFPVCFSSTKVLIKICLPDKL